MKYLITESQIDKVIFKYLDNQDFIQIDGEKEIYFVNSEGDKYAQIRYDEDGLCYIHYKLIQEISSFFSLQESDSKEVIGRYVENTLQMEVTDTPIIFHIAKERLRIPYKWRLQTPCCRPTGIHHR